MIQRTCYKCNDCKDTGWIIEEIKGSQPIMHRCKCVEIELANKQWEKAGLNPSAANKTFSNFEIWNENSEKAKQTAIAFFKNYDEIKTSRKNSIVFCGQPGSGKTHLSIALALNFIKKGIRVIYMPYRDVITSVKQSLLDQEYYNNQLNKYKKAEILLIDDLFKGKINDTDINIMFEIINYRYLNNLPMIISSEFTIDKMLNFDEATGSRIYEMCKKFIVQIEGKENNYRLQ